MEFVQRDIGIHRGIRLLKRKYGDRSDWKRIFQRKYAQDFLDTEKFKGYITLLHTIKVREPLSVTYGEKQVCIVDDQYMWLQQFPAEKKHSVTTMFDASGEVVQWYIDICLRNGMENDIPWIDDLFLDIVLLPTGELFIKDEEELEDALSNGIIDEHLYTLAWNEVKSIKSLIENGTFELIHLAKEHKEMLTKKFKEGT